MRGRVWRLTTELTPRESRAAEAAWSSFSDCISKDFPMRSFKVQVASDDVVVGKVTDQIDGLAAHIVDAVENIPDRVFVPSEGRVEKVRSVSLKVSRSPFLHFDGEISLDFTE